MNILLLVVIVILIVFAVREKTRQRKATSVSSIPEEIKPSPVSQALTELVAIAGGIYISLLVITTFLDLELPATVEIFSVEIDTIAGIALALALIQPFILRISKKFTKR